MTQNKAIVLVGPTASGKSSVAQFLADRAGVPLVSADSMNIYRGMDIGTAKPTLAERADVPYFGVDLVEPTDLFNVGDWLNAVKPAFDDPARTPIVAGGTGLYVKCLLSGLAPMPPADEELRARAQKMTLAQLQFEARNAAPEAYAELSDPENPRRLVRLLEHGGLPKTEPKVLPTVVGLRVERPILLKRIEKRVHEMYADGLIEEARLLQGQTLSATAEKAIGYAEAFAVLDNRMTVAQAQERTIIRTRQLAKRQMTWFRTQLNVQWVEPQAFSSLEAVAEAVLAAGEAVPVSL